MYIALPDDIMVKIFMSFTVKDILNCLCLVCKRWKAISKSHQLWRILPLDNCKVKCLNKGNLLSILAHSSGFECLSINYIELPELSYTILQNSLIRASKLVYLDLSGQPLMNIDFIRMEKVPPLVTLTLDDYLNLYTGSEQFMDIIRLLTNLRYLSLNRVSLSQRQAITIAKAQPELFLLGLSGAHGLCSRDVLTILQSCNVRLHFLQLSPYLNHKEALRDLCSEYDVTVNFV